jgi:hypothetical protein
MGVKIETAESVGCARLELATDRLRVRRLADLPTNLGYFFNK